MSIRNIALINASSHIKDTDAAATAAALQKQATRDLEPIWNIHATINYFPDLKFIPVGYWPIIIADNIKLHAHGYHNDEDNQPYAFVESDDQWQLSCSHEAMEMIVDPYGNHLITSDSIDINNPGRARYLVEVCDPCEDPSFGYTINGILVSDFCTPAYFDPVTNPSTRYSYTGAITQPKEVKDNGYLTWKDPLSKKWYQANYFGESVVIAELKGIQNNGESLRSQVDRLTKVPDTSFSYKAMTGKHQLTNQKNLLASELIAKSISEKILYATSETAV